MARVLGLLMVTQLAACGRSSGESPSSVSTAPSIVGTWKSGCISAGNNWYGVITMTNDASSSKLDTAQYFNDSQCVVARLVDSVSRAYTIGDAVTGLDSAFKINMTYGATTRTYMVQENVDSANTDKGFGASDWTINQAKDVSGKKYAATSSAIDAVGTLYYLIFKVDGAKYFTGDIVSGDGTSDAKRPTALNTTISLTKQ